MWFVFIQIKICIQLEHSPWHPLSLRATRLHRPCRADKGCWGWKMCEQNYQQSRSTSNTSRCNGRGAPALIIHTLECELKRSVSLSKGIYHLEQFQTICGYREFYSYIKVPLSPYSIVFAERNNIPVIILVAIDDNARHAVYIYNTSNLYLGRICWQSLAGWLAILRAAANESPHRIKSTTQGLFFKVCRLQMEFLNLIHLLDISSNIHIARCWLWLLVGITNTYAEQQFITLAQLQTLQIRLCCLVVEEHYRAHHTY